MEPEGGESIVQSNFKSVERNHFLVFPEQFWGMACNIVSGLEVWPLSVPVCCDGIWCPYGTTQGQTKVICDFLIE